MTDVAIRVQGLSKQYRIGARAERYRTLRDTLATAALAPYRRIRAAFGNGPVTRPTSIWALKCVSFEVKQGEIVGIIGRNGAGKSTLLKILSRITEPTEGYAEIRGRVGSLLEVGTGFHPELTGRENIYLNGAILGMKRAEIQAKFEEIVAFAEVEPFIDTPVKHYSSGMALRLAFGVAAHLEPEILLVDELLAVGDIAFQHKCIGKMSEVAAVGRTVLFVSHNTAAIRQLCTRAVVLCNGAVSLDDDAATAVDAYLSGVEAGAAADVSRRTDRKGQGGVRLCAVEVCNGGVGAAVATGGPAQFRFMLSQHLPQLSCQFTVYDSGGTAVLAAASHVPGIPTVHSRGGDRPCFVCDIPQFFLVPGAYRVNVAISSRGVLQDHIEGAHRFFVRPGHVPGSPTTSPRYGRIFLPHTWEVPAMC